MVRGRRRVPLAPETRGTQDWKAVRGSCRSLDGWQWLMGALHLTDGRVKIAQLTPACSVPANPGHRTTLFASVSWGNGGGFQFRDWADYQPTRDEVRAKTRERAPPVPGIPAPESEHAITTLVTHHVNAVTDDVTNASKTTLPSRPVPIPWEREHHPNQVRNSTKPRP